MIDQPIVVDYAVEGFNVHWVPAGAPTDEFVNWVYDQNMLGFDVETGGPEPLNHFHPGFIVRIISFAAGTEAWVLDASHTDVIRGALQTDALFVAHNATFDVLACQRAFDVAPTSVVDTFLLALLVFPPAGADDDEDELPTEDRYRLKPLSVRTGSKALFLADAELHRWFQDLEEKPKGGDQSNSVRAWEGRCYATCPIDDPRYWVYNGLDGIFCVRVLYWLLKRWDGDASDIRRLTRTESELGQILAGIQWRGLRVDLITLESIFDAAVAAQVDLIPSFEAFGVQNPASAPQMHNAFEAWNVVDPVYSEAGQISTDKTAGMPRLLEPDQPDEVRDLANLLLVYRGHQKLRAKVREISDVALDGDGRVHPSVNALKAKTGRMSIQRPALQNLPKNDQRIRAAFLAEEGYVLVGADFAQVEFRVAAALSEDRNMIDAILAGQDLHNVTATRIFGPEFTPEQRGFAKNVGFAVQYGGGPGRVGAMTKLSVQASKNLIEKFFKAYPGLQRYIKKVNSRPDIELKSGRRISVDPERTYANLNYFVQGTARDLFVDALLRLDAMTFLTEDGVDRWSNYLWLVIHDEIILQVPEHLAEQAAAALEEAMNTTFLGVPITAEAKILGDRWGHLEEETAA